MLISKNDKSFKMVVGENNKRKLISLEQGDFLIRYVKEDNVYIIQRKDNKKIDGTEKGNCVCYGNMQEPKTLSEIIEFCIDSYTSMQHGENENMFVEFDYKFSEGHDKIIIYPLYLENIVDVTMSINTSKELAFRSTGVKIGAKTRKRCIRK